LRRAGGCGPVRSVFGRERGRVGDASLFRSGAAADRAADGRDGGAGVCVRVRVQCWHGVRSRWCRRPHRRSGRAYSPVSSWQPWSRDGPWDHSPRRHDRLRRGLVELVRQPARVSRNGDVRLWHCHGPVSRPARLHRQHKALPPADAERPGSPDHDHPAVAQTRGTISVAQAARGLFRSLCCLSREQHSASTLVVWLLSAKSSVRRDRVRG